MFISINTCVYKLSDLANIVDNILANEFIGSVIVNITSIGGYHNVETMFEVVGNRTRRINNK
jgi:hypothetical protein